MSNLCTSDLGLAEELFEDLQDSKLAEMPITAWQLLDIATKIRANNLNQAANVISCEGSYPTALEHIAICLGATPGKQFSSTITDALIAVADSNNSIANAIKKANE